jgi:hypothetical protein
MAQQGLEIETVTPRRLIKEYRNGPMTFAERSRAQYV